MTKSGLASLAPLRATRVARLVLEAAASRACHLVGGALRDQALGLAWRDLDAVVAGGGRLVAERLAGSLPARLVPVGGERFAAFRLVGKGLTVDIWDRQDETLEADLARRDLTINSIALDLKSGRVIDPHAGIADLAGRRLRATSRSAFELDPIRVLRLARFAGRLPRFEPDLETVELARASAGGISQSAPERVRVELELTFGQPTFRPAMNVMIRTTVYPGLWRLRPGAGSPSGPIRSHLATLERLALPVREGIEGQDGIGRLDLGATRLALAFRVCSAVGADDEEALVKLWRRAGYLTKRAARLSASLLEWTELPRSEPELRWFLHRNGRLWPSALCLLGAVASSDERATWEDVLGELLRLERTAAHELFQPPSLLTAGEVQDLCGPLEGPRLGAVMRALRRRQIEGAVRDRAAALALVEELVTRRRR